MTWHLLVDAVGRSGPENMAIDEALLEESGRTGHAFLRLYRWDPPCLSLGRNEPAIDAPGVATVRRPTGGRAVWHEHEVTYAVAAPVASFGSLRESYRAIHERLAAALRTLGVDAALAPDRRGLQPPKHLAACFSSSVGGEVLVGGRKLIGSAQVRRGAAFLQHGSILLDGSQEIVRAVSRQPSASGGETTLRQVLGRPVAFHEVADAIAEQWNTEETPTVSYRPLPSPTVPFADPAWTWRR